MRDETRGLNNRPKSERRPDPHPLTSMCFSCFQYLGSAISEPTIDSSGSTKNTPHNRRASKSELRKGRDSGKRHLGNLSQTDSPSRGSDSNEVLSKVMQLKPKNFNPGSARTNCATTSARIAPKSLSWVTHLPTPDFPIQPNVFPKSFLSEFAISKLSNTSCFAVAFQRLLTSAIERRRGRGMDPSGLRW